MIKLSSQYEKKATDKLTSIIQSLIKEKGLVDTGTLLNSISTKIVYNNDEISFEISGEDYFIYLDGEYSITADAMKSPAFNKVLEIIEEGLAEAIEKEIGE